MCEHNFHQILFWKRCLCLQKVFYIPWDMSTKLNIIVNMTCWLMYNMRCVLAVYFTHFWPGRWVSYLWLETSCPVVALQQKPGIEKFSACGWTSGFSTVYTGTISLTIRNMAASASVHRYPFLSYGKQWLNDPANVGCFIAGVHGLPRSCTSCSEQQVSHCDTCVCLRCWDKCWPDAFSCNSL